MSRTRLLRQAELCSFLRLFSLAATARAWQLIGVVERSGACLFPVPSPGCRAGGLVPYYTAMGSPGEIEGC
jgi:hypothetical protein